MGELGALTLRHLRTTLRSRLARIALLFFLGAMVGAALLDPGGTEGGSLFLLLALLALLFLVGGVVISAGTVLPEDRAAGREEWLSTLAPPGWKRRLSVVVAAWSLALAVGLGGGLLIGFVAGLVGSGRGLSDYEPLPLPARAVIGRRSQACELELPAAGAGGRTLELEVRTSLADRATLHWEVGPREGEREIAARGPVRIELPAGATRVRLTCRTGHLRLRLVAARLLGSERPILPILGLTGLLLGLLAGAIAPLAVLISRITTAQTATATAFILLLFGVARQALLTLSTDLDTEGLRQLAPLILAGFSHLVPEIPVVDVFSQVLAGLVPTAGLWALLGPTLLHAAVTLCLVCAPVPRRFTQGVSP